MMTKGKKVSTRKKLILVAAAWVLLSAVLFPWLWARHRAAEYLEEKYGEAIVLEDVKFVRTRANVFRGSYSVRAEYDGVTFEVYTGRDTYTEFYQQKRYADLLLSNGMEELIGVVSVTMMDIQSGVAALERTDVMFSLWLNFEKTFGTNGEYAAAVRQVLDRLEEAKLTCCDQLHTNGYVDGAYMQCSVYPQRGEMTDAEILSAVTIVPPSGYAPLQ